MPGPASFESRYYLGAAPWHTRLWRDLRIIGSSARFIWLWLTLGRRVRRAVADAERDGRVLCLEELFGAGDRK